MNEIYNTTKNYLIYRFSCQYANVRIHIRGENSYKKEKCFLANTKKQMIDGYCEKYRYTNPQSFI